MKIKFTSTTLPASGTLIVFAAEGAKLAGLAAAADARTGGHISRAIKAAQFTGKRDSQLDVIAAGKFDRAVVFGLGSPETLTAREIELLGGAIAGTLQAMKTKQAAIAVDFASKSVKAGAVAAFIASGLRLRTYGFNAYKTKKSDAPKSGYDVAILTGDQPGARKAFAAHDAIADGVHMARDLVNEPPNRLFPIAFAKRARELTRHGVKVEIFDAKQMKRLGMGALLGVAQGSAHEARMVVMRWDGGKRGQQPVAFVGKGVTFDTGGISIKPAAGMEDMKGDMGGAACVTGLMLALAKRRAKVNAVGAIGLVENMPDGKAQRPGDIVTSMSGQTIAVLNTDAEGRLVLADVLWYVQKRFKPKFMVNLATLTGAIMVALGKEFAGMFSNNDELAERLASHGYETGEKVWRMPLAPEYDKLIDSDVADMKNIGGRYGGAVTAAQFLQRFVNNVPWAHLDIAGTAMDSNKSPINHSWGSGWGVRLLNAMVAKHYEV